ncbi:MAG: MarR family transcriptional regulator [Candidatus Omnitrophica bacterium]|nr:MarR family transcriptional regulator [Candidatus Omnitrophota bacterium]
MTSDLDKLIYAVEKIMINFHAFARDEIRKEGISIPQYYILCHLDKLEEIRMSDCKKILASSGAFATNIADQLIKKGFITRERNQKDRRIVAVKISIKGQELVKRMKQERNDFYNSLIAELNKKEIKKISESFYLFVKQFNKLNK